MWNIKSGAVTLALECDSDLKNDTSKSMACSFYERFLSLLRIIPVNLGDKNPVLKSNSK